MSFNPPDTARGNAVTLEERPHIAILRFNRPERRNPLSLETLGALEQHLDRLGSRTDISAIIFTGSGKVFASGANIQEVRELTPGTARHFAGRGQSLFRKIAEARPLTIAAVNGFCMGGGLDLALACRLRYAERTAVFAHPGARLGIITGWGGTQRLARLVGPARALELMLTARQITADEAFEFGLVDQVGESALDCAIEAVRQYRLS